MPQPAVHVQGLRELRRDLKRLAPEVDKELRKELRDVARPIIQTAQALTPRRTGALAASLRPSVTQKAVAIRSRLPYANVIHWGGRTGPQRTTRIQANPFLSRAIEQHADQVVDAMGDAVDRAADRAGWH